MTDVYERKCRCCTPSELLQFSNDTVKELSHEEGRLLGRLVMRFLGEDPDDAHIRADGRTVRELLEEARVLPSRPALRAGEVDGMSYRLHDVPPQEKADD